MIHARRLGSSSGAQAAMALMAAALLAVAGIGGYAIGSSVGRSQVVAAPPSASTLTSQTCGGQEAPPILGPVP
jgi:hypothetical protein